jgi:hypothetical protein
MSHGYLGFFVADKNKQKGINLFKKKHFLFVQKSCLKEKNKLMAEIPEREISAGLVGGAPSQQRRRLRRPNILQPLNLFR